MPTATGSTTAFSGRRRSRCRSSPTCRSARRARRTHARILARASSRSAAADGGGAAPRGVSLTGVEPAIDAATDDPALVLAIERAARLTANVERVVHGKSDEIRLVLAALISGGHVLLEDLPGTAKTV